MTPRRLRHGTYVRYFGLLGLESGLNTHRSSPCSRDRGNGKLSSYDSYDSYASHASYAYWDEAGTGNLRPLCLLPLTQLARRAA